MATIALYANQINSMPGFANDVRSSVNGLKSELMNLKNKSQSIDRNICNLDDVISSISASTQTQEDKMNALSNLGEDVKQFASEVERIDGNVAGVINKSKNDFYNKYYYLKPDCEKNALEKIWSGFKSGLQSVGEWCKEHWKLAVTAVLVAVAIAAVIFLPGVGGAIAAITLAAAKGLLVGALVGGISGGIMNVLDNKSFFEGFEDGAFSGAITGAITGAISGGLKFAEAAGKFKPLTKLGKFIFSEPALEAGSSVLEDVGGIVIDGKETSGFEIFSNAALAATVSVFSPKIPGITKGRGSWNHVWETQFTRSVRHKTSMSLKTKLKGIGVDVVTQACQSGIKEGLKYFIKQEEKGNMWNLFPQHFDITKEGKKYGRNNNWQFVPV